MRIGVCGGTFDPFHRGHLDPVLAAREPMRWDRVIYVPAQQQPFKRDQPATSSYHRFAMAQLATRDHDEVWVTPMELERGGISYTVDTLEELHRRYPEAELDWIIGDDNVTDLARWRNLKRLFELARFVVLTRSGVSLPAANDRIVYAGNETVPISSTEIRSRVRAGQPIDEFVDPLVSRYIHHYGLYKEGQS
jgi:nicotinate-nucleotide adenylyltransferase